MSGTDHGLWTDEDLRAIAAEFKDSRAPDAGEEIALIGCRVLLQEDGRDTAVMAEAVSIGRGSVMVATRSPVSVGGEVTARWIGTRSGVAPARLRALSVDPASKGGWMVRFSIS